MKNETRVEQIFWSPTNRPINIGIDAFFIVYGDGSFSKPYTPFKEDKELVEAINQAKASDNFMGVIFIDIIGNKIKGISSCSATIMGEIKE